MAMVFTIVSSTQEWLNSLLEKREEEQKLQAEKKKQEQEEQERV